MLFTLPIYTTAPSWRHPGGAWGPGAARDGNRDGGRIRDPVRIRNRIRVRNRGRGRHRSRDRIRDRGRDRDRDGGRVRGRDRTHHFRIAYGSALEAGSLLELLDRLGAVDQQRATATLELLDRVRALTWRLIHPRR